MNDDDVFAGLKGAVHDERAREGAHDDDDEGGRDDGDALFAAAAKPLDDRARARIAATLAAKVAASKGAPVTASPTASAPASPSNVLPLRPSRLRYASLLAGAVAVAASVALVVGRRDEAGAPLPAYALVVSGGDRDVRGAPDTLGLANRTEVHLGAGSRLELVLRPTTKVDGAVEARGFLSTPSQHGTFTPWRAPLEAAEGGAVRVAGEASTLFTGMTGVVDVAIAVGRTGTVPNDATAALTPGRAGVQVVRCRVVLGPGS